MRRLKYTLWIALLFLVQTVIINDLRAFSVRPDIILPFVILSALKEDSFKVSAVLSIVCAVLAGALCGKNFSFAVLFYTYTGAIVFNSKRKSRYMPTLLRYFLWIATAAVISEAISYLILYKSLQWFLKAFILYMIPSVIYTLIASAFLYPVITSTLYKNSTKKHLI